MFMQTYLNKLTYYEILSFLKPDRGCNLKFWGETRSFLKGIIYHNMKKQSLTMGNSLNFCYIINEKQGHWLRD